MGATLGQNVTKLGTLESILGKDAVKQILYEAYGNSLVGSLAGGIPMPITGSSIAFATGAPVAGVVGEGELKPVINQKVATKTAKPIKVAAVMYWSKEARQGDKVGYMNLLKNTAKDAISRAIDMAVIHGKNALTNSPISGVEYVAQSKNSVTLGTANATSGGLAADIISGYELVLDGGGKMDSFAADERMRVKLLKAVDTQGRPIFSANARGGVNLADKMGDLLGFPVAYSDAVSGHLGTVPDTGVRLIGGAFKDNLKFGYVESMSYRYADTGTIQDGDVSVNLFQQNMEAFIVEAQFGWVIRDVNSFALYKEAPTHEG